MALARQQELDTYHRNLTELLRHEGKYVVVRGDQIAGVWDAYVEALTAAYQRYGLDPFMVKKIEAQETVHFIPHNILCPQSTSH